MADLMDFTSSLELQEVNATMERWLYGTRDLERRMSERVISLCRYFDRIPEDSMSYYVIALTEALDDDKLDHGFLRSEHLNRSMENFIDHLKSLENPAETVKANLIFEKVSEKFQIDE